MLLSRQTDSENHILSTYILDINVQFDLMFFPAIHLLLHQSFITMNLDKITLSHKQNK